MSAATSRRGVRFSPVSRRPSRSAAARGGRAFGSGSSIVSPTPRRLSGRLELHDDVDGLAALEPGDVPLGHLAGAEPAITWLTAPLRLTVLRRLLHGLGRGPASIHSPTAEVCRPRSPSRDVCRRKPLAAAAELAPLMQATAAGAMQSNVWPSTSPPTPRSRTKFARGSPPRSRPRGSRRPRSAPISLC